jgi:hypothetical protein
VPVVLVVAAAGVAVVDELLSAGAAITPAAPPTRMPTRTATSVFEMVLRTEGFSGTDSPDQLVG